MGLPISDADARWGRRTFSFAGVRHGLSARHEEFSSRGESRSLSGPQAAAPRDSSEPGAQGAVTPRPGCAGWSADSGRQTRRGQTQCRPGRPQARHLRGEREALAPRRVDGAARIGHVVGRLQPERQRDDARRPSAETGARRGVRQEARELPGPEGEAAREEGAIAVNRRELFRRLDAVAVPVAAGVVATPGSTHGSQPERALSQTSPHCPKCGRAILFPSNARETPTADLPVECWCGWKGVSSVLHQV